MCSRAKQECKHPRSKALAGRALKSPVGKPRSPKRSCQAGPGGGLGKGPGSGLQQMSSCSKQGAKNGRSPRKGDVIKRMIEVLGGAMGTQRREILPSGIRDGHL